MSMQRKKMRLMTAEGGVELRNWCIFCDILWVLLYLIITTGLTPSELRSAVACFSWIQAGLLTFNINT